MAPLEGASGHLESLLITHSTPLGYGMQTISFEISSFPGDTLFNNPHFPPRAESPAIYMVGQ